MSKQFNYGVKNKMKGTICKQISVKVTLFQSISLQLCFHVFCPLCSWTSPILSYGYKEVTKCQMKFCFFT